MSGRSLLPQWSVSNAGTLIEKIAKYAQSLLPRSPHCVAGQGFSPGEVHVHVLDVVPQRFMAQLSEMLSQALPATIVVDVSCRHAFNVALPPPAKAWSALEPAVAGEACGNCGTRAVVQRRCDFCGGRS